MLCPGGAGQRQGTICDRRGTGRRETLVHTGEMSSSCGLHVALTVGTSQLYASRLMSCVPCASASPRQRGFCCSAATKAVPPGKDEGGGSWAGRTGVSGTRSPEAFPAERVPRRCSPAGPSGQSGPTRPQFGGSTAGGAAAPRHPPLRTPPALPRAGGSCGQVWGGGSAQARPPPEQQHTALLITNEGETSLLKEQRAVQC